MPRQKKPKAGFREFFDRATGALQTPNEHPKPIPELGYRAIPESRIKEIYEREAGTYNSRHNPLFAEQEARTIINHGLFRPTDLIASIGSGTAIFESFVAKEILRNGKMTCVDIAHNMGKEAKKTIARTGAGRISVVTGSATAVPLASASQDKVLAIQTNLPNTIHSNSFFGEARRAIKPAEGSRFIFSFISENKDADLKEIQENLSRNRFVPLMAVTFAKKGNYLGIAVIARPALLEDLLH